MEGDNTDVLELGTTPFNMAIRTGAFCNSSLFNKSKSKHSSLRILETRNTLENLRDESMQHSLLTS